MLNVDTQQSLTNNSLLSPRRKSIAINKMNESPVIVSDGGRRARSPLFKKLKGRTSIVSSPVHQLALITKSLKSFVDLSKTGKTSNQEEQKALTIVSS